MKGEEAAYTLSLKKAKLFPKRERMIKAIGLLKKFVYKHARNKNILLANEVNEYLHKNSKNVPEKISVTLRKDEENIRVYLEGGKQLDLDKKASQERKEKEKKEEKEGKKEEKTGEEKEKEIENKKKLEEKKEKEKASTALEIKRKTGKK